MVLQAKVAYSFQGLRQVLPQDLHSFHLCHIQVDIHLMLYIQQFLLPSCRGHLFWKPRVSSPAKTKIVSQCFMIVAWFS